MQMMQALSKNISSVTDSMNAVERRATKAEPLTQNANELLDFLAHPHNSCGSSKDIAPVVKEEEKMEPSQANVPVSQTNRKYRSKTTAGRARRDPVPFENEEEDIGASQAQVDNDEQEVAPRRKRRGDDDVEKDAADDDDASKRRSAETILPHHKSRQGGSDGQRHRIRSRQRQSCAVQRYGKHLVLKESMRKKNPVFHHNFEFRILWLPQVS